MVNSIVAITFYVSSLAVAGVTLGLIVKSWHDYGRSGQKQTRLFMVLSNSFMVVFLLIRVAHLFFNVFPYNEPLNLFHVGESLFIFLAFLCWLKLFIE